MKKPQERTKTLKEINKIQIYCAETKKPVRPKKKNSSFIILVLNCNNAKAGAYIICVL